MSVFSPKRIAVPLALLAAAPFSAAVAQNAAGAATSAPASGGSWDPQRALRAETFIKPPENIERMVMAPRVDISFENQSPDRRWFLRPTGTDRGDIKAYGAPHIWLGGLQVDTRANRARSVTTSTRNGLQLVDPRTGSTRELQVPAGASISAPVWSPTGSHVAFIANFPTASYAYVADVTTGKSTRLSERPLLATFVTDLEFTGDGKHVVTVLVPATRGALPTHGAGDIEDGPQVRLTESRAVPQPVHFSLLKDPHEKAQLTYYTTGQVALIDVRSKAVRNIGAPTMVRDLSASHDGAWVRVTRMVEPFSYLVPVNNFGTVQELWDGTGKVVSTLARTPLREAQAGGGFGGGDAVAASDTTKRNLQWYPIGAGILYIKNVPGAAPAAPAGGRSGGPNGGNAGDSASGRGQGMGAGAPIRVQAAKGQIVLWRAPYGPNDTTVLYQGGPQLTNVAFSTDSTTMFVADSGAVIAVRVKEPAQRFNLGRNVRLPAAGGGPFGGGGPGGGAQNTDSTAGQLVARRVHGVNYVLLGKDGKSVALTGTRAPGANWYKQAPRPFLDRMDITSRSRTRLMDSPTDTFEEFVAALDDDVSQFIVTRESRTTIQDAWLRSASGSDAKQLTKNVDVGPEVSGAISKRFQVTRPRDGTKYWVDILLPRDWKPGQKLPGIIWFYPREYSNLQDYERSRYNTNINAFPAVPSSRPASAQWMFVSQGYAFIQPDIPIYGDAGRMNDNYTRDLKENLDAVINAAVDSGFVDRDRMGLGGHSYGAFSTVNAMSLMPNFKAGIAGDGMYNRTLTPFGFQSERRNFYQAQSTYLDMSPFLRADKISGALLLYHALEDQNTGTDPISSTRMYAALQGLGKNAALYMYPYEDHSVSTYASDLDLWARWVAWMDTYVKNAKPSAAIVP
jgi:dipeptidyl aminopeptidase/acylaminoacyl peptidase